MTDINLNIPQKDLLCMSIHDLVAKFELLTQEQKEQIYDILNPMH